MLFPEVTVLNPGPIFKHCTEGLPWTRVTRFRVLIPLAKP